MHTRLLKFLVVLAAIMLIPASAYAGVETGSLDQIVKTFHDVSAGWVPKLKVYASSLFWLLVGLDFAWHTINQALQGDEFNGMIGGLMKKIMAYGFFYFVLMQADTWMPAIIGSFSTIGQTVGGGLATGPSTVMDQGFAAVGAIQGVLDQYNMLTSAPTVIVLGIVMIVVLAAYAVCAGQLLVTLVESYLAGSASIIMLGMGGSRWTLDYVQKVLGYTIGAGIKLFVMYLVIGIGLPMVDSYIHVYQASGGQGGVAQALGLLMMALILMFLSFQVPALASAVLTGSVSMTLGSMMSTMATAGAAGLAAAGTTGSTVLGAGSGAAGLSSAVGAASALAGAGSGSMAGNLLSSAAQEVGKKFQGASSGSFGGGMAANMGAAQQAFTMNNAAGSVPPAGNVPGAVPPAPPAPPAPPSGPAAPDTGATAASTASSAPATPVAPADAAASSAPAAPASNAPSAPASPAPAAANAQQSGTQPRTVADMLGEMQQATPGAQINDAASATAPNISINHAGH